MSLLTGTQKISLFTAYIRPAMVWAQMAVADVPASIAVITTVDHVVSLLLDIMLRRAATATIGDPDPSLWCLSPMPGATYNIGSAEHRAQLQDEIKRYLEAIEVSYRSKGFWLIPPGDTARMLHPVKLDAGGMPICTFC